MRDVLMVLLGVVSGGGGALLGVWLYDRHRAAQEMREQRGKKEDAC